MTHIRRHELEPAAAVLRIIGGGDLLAGERLAAVIIDKHPTVVRKWTYPIESGGTAGRVAHRHAELLLAWARRNGVDLHPSHFYARELTD